MITLTEYGPITFIGKQYTSTTEDFNKNSQANFVEGMGALEALFESNNLTKSFGACLYTKWDTENMTTDYIVAYPINQDELSNIDTTGWLVTQIPECQAYITDLDGSYEQLQPTHYAMMDRLQADNQFENNTHTIEEYIVWSENETELKTRVIYTIK
jgi:hypothetical protein